jgi:hypothetical protein
MYNNTDYVPGVILTFGAIKAGKVAQCILDRVYGCTDGEDFDGSINLAAEEIFDRVNLVEVIVLARGILDELEYARSVGGI